MLKITAYARIFENIFLICISGGQGDTQKTDQLKANLTKMEKK